MRTRRFGDQSRAIGMLIGAWLTILICKIYALRGNHDIWSDYGPLYLTSAAAVSSYSELLLAAAICLTWSIGTAALARFGRTARLMFSALMLLALSFVLLINVVNAELLARLGAPLTLPLIRYSDLFASQHARDALWTWAGSSFFFLIFGCVIIGVVAYAAALWAMQYVSQKAVLVLLVAAASAVTFGGITRDPAPPYFSVSGTLAFLRSIPNAGAWALAPREQVAPPFTLEGRQSGLPRPEGEIRNVILVVLEAAAAQYLDLYGANHGVTPNLAARRNELIVIENAYAQSASSTVALETLLSSRYPALGAQPSTSDRPMLPNRLSASGIRTALFHSSDTRFGAADDLLSASGFGTVRDTRDRRCGGARLEDRYSSLGNADACTLADLLNWVEEKPGQPFFAMLWTFQTHYPYFARPERPVPLDPQLGSTRARQDRQRYLATLREADRLIEALIRRLQRIGRYDDTLA